MLVLAQRLGGFAYLALAGQEHQHVAFQAADGELVQCAADGLRHILCVAFLVLLRRTVAHLDRIGAAGDLQHGRIGKMLGEALRIQRSRGDDEFEIGAPRQQLAQVAQQEIDIQRALVRLVDDDGVVLPELRVMVDLGQQDTVGHQLDAGIGRHLVVETHLVADQSAEFRLQLMRDARPHRARRHAARLGVADHAEHPAPQTQTYLGQLGGLARTRLAANDDHLVLFNGLSQLLAPRHDGQVGGVFDFGELLDTRQAALGDGR